MADTPEPNSLVLICSVIGTLIGAGLAAWAGVRKSIERHTKGAAEGDLVQASGVLVVSDASIKGLEKQMGRVAAAAEKIAKGMFDEKEQQEQAERESLLRKQDEVLAGLAELKRRQAEAMPPP